MLAVLLGSCGYTMGYPTPAGVRRIALQVVDNLSFRQRLERDLTRAVQVSLGDHSGLRITDQAHADAVLRIDIVAVRNSTLVLTGPTAPSGEAAPVREGSLDAIARIRLVSRRSGEVLVDTRSREIAEYRVPIGESESSARRELVSELARLIVLALERDF